MRKNINVITYYINERREPARIIDRISKGLACLGVIKFVDGIALVDDKTNEVKGGFISIEAPKLLGSILSWISDEHLSVKGKVIVYTDDDTGEITSSKNE